MTARNISSERLGFLLNELSGVIDFNKDLPSNVFVGGGFVFWFFERPLLSYFDLFHGLISASLSSFKSDVFIKFSGREFLVDSCFSVSGVDNFSDAQWISKESVDFFGGKVGYPIILFNGTYDWVALESAREEFGVIAMKVKSSQVVFSEYLESNFISSEDLVLLASGTSAESVIAKAFICSYCS
ncbi:MAG: hypothetical protein Q7T27_20925 [Pseudomonas sp.]|uniref:hypothetical protein n=1 Tax=Pseudomonas sp. TaxID=306 RepID=UPI002717C23C|nr:hypothetical protein [Pseudomonas sp.]MDO8405960.1 hypothetical protein [Pseudomonas sp.]